ncbi:MAG: hypothetical protein EOO36_02510 [Cytophagaceae bacterium]|nr:MAG: hypothetical protein EOO36_02510 [Cytophagaceae bacterium]
MTTTHPSPASLAGPGASVVVREGAGAGRRAGRSAPASPGPAGRGRASGAATASTSAGAPAAVRPPAVPAAPVASYAAARNVRTQAGRIIDEAGQPLVGATVLLKGTTQGTSTDANGDYSLAVPLGVNTFVFGYSGYTDEVAQSPDGQPLTVTLLPLEGRAPVAQEKAGKPRLRKKDH